MGEVMTYKGYCTKVTYDSGTNELIGKIEDINDLILFSEKNVDAFRIAFEESVDDYLETCKLIGKEPQKVYSGQFNVRISSELHRKACAEARRSGITLNAYVSEAIKEKAERKLDEATNNACMSKQWSRAFNTSPDLWNKDMISKKVYAGYQS